MSKMENNNVLLTTITSNDTSMQLALYYLKTFAEKYYSRMSPKLDIDVKIFLPKKTPNEIYNEIIALNPKIIGFSCYLWNIEKILKITKLLKTARPDIKLILGGPEVSPEAIKYLSSNHTIDYIIRGEGEESFLELIESILYGSKKIETIKGITYRNGKIIIENENRPEIDNLDRIPSPFLNRTIDLTKHNTVNIETMRGCTSKCNFCYYHKSFSKIRYFSLERIEKEFKLILSSGIKILYLMDSTFNLNLERAKRILELFIKYNKGTKLHIELKSELLDDEIVNLLKKSNTCKIEIGVQSINLNTAILINRTFNEEKIKKGIRLLSSAGIDYEIHLIDSLPGESYEDIKKSLDWVMNLNVPEIIIMRLSILPGTFFKQHAEELGLKYDDKPPYFSISNSKMNSSDLDKLMELRYSLDMLYHRKLLRKSIFVITEDISISPTDILEEWIIFVKEKKGLKINTEDFVKKIYKNKKQKTIPNILLESIKEDLQVYKNNK